MISNSKGRVSHRTKAITPPISSKVTTGLRINAKLLAGNIIVDIYSKIRLADIEFR